MSNVTRHIGLSLGADLCWPAAYQALIEKLDLAVPLGDDVVSVDVARTTIRPFDLQGKARFDLVLDRLSHWMPVQREWMKKLVLMDGTYVPNNPWSIQGFEKHTSYVAMMRLGFPIPETWMIPPKVIDVASHTDMAVTVERYSELFDLAEIGEKVGYPAFLKPYDGGGWVGVTRVTDAKSLHAAYDKSGSRVQHLQAAVKDWDVFTRGLGVGPQVNVMRYDPDAPLHGRYVVDYNFLDGEQWVRAQKMTRVINAFFGWDFNSCEMLRAEGELFPIDFANACPDSQVTSLHFHFPWLVKALVRWTVFCTVTRRSPTLNPNWQPYFDIADRADIDFDAKLDLYDKLARDHFDSDAFDAFNQVYLDDLDRIAVDYFDSDAFRDVVRMKVTALYPAHEIDKFTEHFFGLVRFWAKTERERLGLES